MRGELMWIGWAFDRKLLQGTRVMISASSCQLCNIQMKKKGITKARSSNLNARGKGTHGLSSQGIPFP
eukprot:939842-Pelagomonas_calceolata.AAC.4